MSLKEDEIEKQRRYKIEVVKYLENFWNLKQNTLPERMPQKNSFFRREIKNLVKILLEENAERKEKLLKLRKKQLKKSSSTETMKYISKDAKKIINKIGRNIGKIKNSITDITKMNGLFLEQRARKTLSTYRMERKTNEFEKLNLNGEHSLENIIRKGKVINYRENYNNNFNKTQRVDKNNKIRRLRILNDINDKEKEKEKKEKYMKNFLFVNDNYRKQLNFAFLKYNPEKNLENLKLLVQVEPIIRRDITTIKKEIEDDIKWRCDKNHFRKKYEIIKKKFQRSNSVQNTPKMEMRKENILPNLNKKKSIKVFTPKFLDKNFNIYENIKKEENSKIIFPKEEKIEEINYILKASSEIDNLINEENINKKIDLYKTKYDEKSKLKEFYDTNSINLLEKDYFEEEKKRVVDKLGNIYQFQIDKNINDKEKKLKEKIVKDNDILTKKLKEEKASTLNEINDVIYDNTLL